MDQEAICARFICLLVSNRDFDLQKVLSSELAAYPPSMFHPNGSMRLVTGKSTLKKNLAVEVALRTWGAPWCLCLSYKGPSPENWKEYYLCPKTMLSPNNWGVCPKRVQMPLSGCAMVWGSRIRTPSPQPGRVWMGSRPCQQNPNSSHCWCGSTSSSWHCTQAHTMWLWVRASL